MSRLRIVVFLFKLPLRGAFFRICPEYHPQHESEKR